MREARGRRRQGDRDSRWQDRERERHEKGRDNGQRNKREETRLQYLSEKVPKTERALEWQIAPLLLLSSVAKC